jgi:hypothetical protein
MVGLFEFMSIVHHDDAKYFFLITFFSTTWQHGPHKHSCACSFWYTRFIVHVTPCDHDADDASGDDDDGDFSSPLSCKTN